MLPLAAGADVASIGVGDAAIDQPVSGTKPIDFTLTRSGDTTYDVKVRYTTADDSAIAGTDYDARKGVATIPAGASSAVVHVPVHGGDNTQDKSFFLNLLSATGGSAFGFAPPQMIRNDDASFATLLSADLNGDGKPDLLEYNGSANPNLQVLFNTTPVNAKTVRLAAGHEILPPDAPLNIDRVIPTDFDGDGRPDLLVDGSLNRYVLLNRTLAGSNIPAFTPPQQLEGGRPFNTAVADLNGDGQAEVIAVDLDGETSVFFNTTVPGSNTARFRPPQVISAPQADYAEAADINGDGLPDLLLFQIHKFRRLVAYVLINTTAPGSRQLSFAPSQNIGYAKPTADINGDGLPDSLLIQSGNVFVRLNTTPRGSTVPSFGAQQTFATGDPNQFDVLAADFNGDGRLDLLTSDSGSSAVSVSLNTTEPGATKASFASAERFENSVGIWPIVADFNGDGMNDLISRPASSAVIDVSLNTDVNGARLADTFATGTIRKPDTTPDAFSFADKTAPARSNVISGGARITGITRAAPISISGVASARFIIEYPGGGNSGFITGPATVNNGDVIQLQLTSAAVPGATAQAVVAVGSVSRTWTVTTAQ